VSWNLRDLTVSPVLVNATWGINTTARTLLLRRTEASPGLVDETVSSLRRLSELHGRRNEPRNVSRPPFVFRWQYLISPATLNKPTTLTLVRPIRAYPHITWASRGCKRLRHMLVLTRGEGGGACLFKDGMYDVFSNNNVMVENGAER
jgi:hypothetical protein